MAGPIQASKVTSPGPRANYTGPLGDVGWGLAWLDHIVYSVEYIVVVVAMVAMTVVEFVYIASLYVTEQKIAFIQMQDPNIQASFPWSLVILLGFVGLMMFSVVNSTSLGKGKGLPLKLGATAGLLAAVVGFMALTAWFESSSTYYIILTSLIMIPATLFFFKTEQSNKGYLMVGLTVLAYIVSWNVPDGYSWADKRALFLLLWVGFLGASMAAKQQRHLKIDIARKLCPKAWLSRFNGVSYLVAAAFTGLMVYLGNIYLFHPDYGRFWVETIEGEIPDWLKVASIPIALLLIALRFGVRGAILLIWGDRYAAEPDSNPFAAAIEAAEANEAAATQEEAAKHNDDDSDASEDDASEDDAAAEPVDEAAKAPTPKESAPKASASRQKGKSKKKNRKKKGRGGAR